MKFNAENRLINAIGFQSIWWGGALYREQLVPFAVVLILLHFIFLKDRKKEFYFVLLVALTGILTDSVLATLQMFSFENSVSFGLTWVPVWMMLLWVSFACTLNHCLSWVFENKMWLLLVGSLGGAFSYIGAIKFGAISPLVPINQVFFTLVVLWGLLFMFFNLLKEKLECIS